MDTCHVKIMLISPAINTLKTSKIQMAGSFIKIDDIIKKVIAPNVRIRLYKGGLINKKRAHINKDINVVADPFGLVQTPMYIPNWITLM
jgi:hypothetical protein